MLEKFNTLEKFKLKKYLHFSFSIDYNEKE